MKPKPGVLWSFSGATLIRAVADPLHRWFELKVGNTVLHLSPEEALRLGKALIYELEKRPT